MQLCPGVEPWPPHCVEERTERLEQKQSGSHRNQSIDKSPKWQWHFLFQQSNNFLNHREGHAVHVDPSRDWARRATSARRPQRREVRLSRCRACIDRRGRRMRANACVSNRKGRCQFAHVSVQPDSTDASSSWTSRMRIERLESSSRQATRR